ncbi:MAG: hypothetical protein BAA01_13430 [Bacillus thermozeamaize]|uniref:PqqD family protein n=1 Tax=Bacillus thermozeamaize TaxID=230954 RepID=A0A1Y3PNY8_9BACI|nr:MAG: hypothetical protein BAA01_13430 [Bacillus thermozeamaize]
MKITLNKKNIVEYVEDHEYILIDMLHNKFYTLDYIGSQIWNYLSRGFSLDHTVTQISNKFGVSVDQVKSDVIEFLEKLKSKGLVKIEN